MLDEPVRGSLPPPDFYSLSGIEQCRAWLRSSVPTTPLARLVGYRPTQLESGNATFTMAASPWLQFGEGTVDLKILMEEALGAAAFSVSPAAMHVITAALNTHHFRPSTVESGSFVARARVLSSGSAFTTAEVLVEDGLGRATAHAMGSLIVRPMDPPPPPHRGFPEFEEPTYATPDPHLRPAPTRALPDPDVSTLDAMRGYFRGEYPEPPIGRLLGIKYVEFSDDGSGAVSMAASPWLRSRSTDIQCGPIATLMHTALGLSPIVLTKANEYIGIVNQGMTFLAPVTADGRDLVARYRLVHGAGELLFSTVEVIDADGNRVAMGSQTSVLRERRRRAGGGAARERVLATVLFTDIVGSTRRAQQLGDERWRELLDEHHDVVRRQLKTFNGREIKTVGDGFLAAFDSPARAVQCARAIRDGLRHLGIEIRAGIHTGECERVGGDLAGIAVHAAARIESAATPGEILVSSTVHDLVAGSGLAFADRGVHELKDLDGQRQLFAVAD